MDYTQAAIARRAFEEGIHHACSLMEFATAKGKGHKIIPIAVCKITTEVRRGAKELAKERYAQPLPTPKQ